MSNNKRGPQARRGQMSLEELRAHQAALTLQRNEERRARGLEQAEVKLAESLRVANARHARKEARKAAVADLIREGEHRRKVDSALREGISQSEESAVNSAIHASELKNP